RGLDVARVQPRTRILRRAQQLVTRRETDLASTRLPQRFLRRVDGAHVHAAEHQPTPQSDHDASPQEPPQPPSIQVFTPRPHVHTSPSRVSDIRTLTRTEGGR